LSRDVIIHDIRGRRTCTDSDFPLAIGGGAQADIRLPNIRSDATFAVVARSDSHLFVQPADSRAPVLVNGEPLSESRWLEHGDVLRIARSSVRFEAGATSITFKVDGGTPAPALRPPNEPPPAAGVSAGATAGGVPRASLRRPSTGRKVVAWVAFGVFLVLALAAGFVFLATPVSLQVIPAPERVSIDGGFPGFEVGGRLLLIPGVYRVRAAKAGYRPLDVSVEIAAIGEQALEYTLEKLPGIVTFDIRPEVEATVSMDGAPLGSTPLEGVEIAPGAHAFTVDAERYAPALLEVEVRGLGERQSIEAVLSPLWAPVSVASKPAGANVLLDGNVIGETPLVAEILEGSYTLGIAREGYDTVSMPLRVIANQELRLPEFALVESDGQLIVDTKPSGATVTVAGQYRGQTPLELSLAPRKVHTLKIARAGYESIERQVQVDPAASETLTLALAPRFGTVLITSRPVDAQLYVDGRLHGSATGRVKLTTTKHRLEIKKPGYEVFSTTVTPRAGVTQELSVTLATVAQAKAAARKPVIETAEGQELRLVQPSRFRMGASRREQGRRANESQRLVELTRPYYLGVKEVSNKEFRRFKSSHVSGSIRGNSLDGPSQPVAQVSWEDAVSYLNWLSAKDSLAPAYRREGKSFVAVDPPTTGYRLPTEAEWAYAARYAGRTDAAKYSWGGAFPPSGAAGNYADSSASTLLANTLGDYADGYRVSAPVGSFTPTGPGFFDLGGNVAEWCQDFYAVYPNAADALTVDPKGPTSGRHHVVRGSSWRHASISELRLSYRDYSEKPRTDLGFRIARYAD